MSPSGLACLPMYDFPWTAAALDAFWFALTERLRAEGVEAPTTLTRGPPLAAMWRDPELILGQTCGYPYWFGLRESVAVIAAPVYGFEGCDGARHRSFLIARREDARRELAAFRGARAAINARDSNSGMNLFRAAVAPLARSRPFFAGVVVTGAHVNSLAAVAEGAADIAAIDCVTFGLLARGRPELVERVRVFAHTPASPALPFIASAAHPPEMLATIRQCLTATLADAELATELRALGLVGVEVLDPGEYAEVAKLERGAVDLGYPKLA
jgi:ABC-type phosphate/phosphonate transport system substrate-binding protein